MAFAPECVTLRKLTPPSLIFSPSVGKRHSLCKAFVSFGDIIGSRHLSKPLSALTFPGALYGHL